MVSPSPGAVSGNPPPPRGEPAASTLKRRRPRAPAPPADAPASPPPPPPPPPPTADAVLRAGAAGLRANVVLALVARAVSFTLRAATARALGPARLAYADIRLNLLMAAALLPAVAAARPVALRCPSDASAVRVAAVGAAGSSAAAAVALAAALVLDARGGGGGGGGGDSLPSPGPQDHHAAALTAVALGAAVEAAAELPLVVGLRRQADARVAALRAAALVAGAVVSTVGVGVASGEGGGGGASATTWVGVGKVAYAGVLLVGGLAALASPAEVAALLRSPAVGARSSSSSSSPPSSSWSSLHGARPRGGSRWRFCTAWLDAPSVRLAAGTTGRAVVSFCLAHGEDGVLEGWVTPDERGAYKLAANVAALAARFLFQPLEEACFSVFSRLDRERGTAAVVAAGTSDVAPVFLPASGEAGAATALEAGAADADGPSQDSTCGPQLAAPVPLPTSDAGATTAALTLSLHFALLTGLTLAVIGPAFARPFIRLVYGAGWAATPAAHLLSLSFVYSVFLASNGVTEAYVMATAGPAALSTHAAFGAAVSAAYVLAAAAGARRWGAAGVVAANCANMAARTVYSVAFIGRAATQRTPGGGGSGRGGGRRGGRAGWAVVRAGVPGGRVVATLAAAGVAAAASERWVLAGGGAARLAAHAAVGGGGVAATVAAVAAWERVWVADVCRVMGWRRGGKGGKAG
ncbi:hypothetical protein I4F81_007817 [Pyropia yezoensis]|uniref:Uncharacterized protein n=1 Tax=Pyropia yezoensis TaxID=2788 RepID=A0ACC3C5T7_PYRYE|nr:hypothetical protein I4F81_007817 [Neopyropia yezoensis]